MNPDAPDYVKDRLTPAQAGHNMLIGNLLRDDGFRISLVSAADIKSGKSKWVPIFGDEKVMEAQLAIGDFETKTIDSDDLVYLIVPKRNQFGWAAIEDYFHAIEAAAADAAVAATKESRLAAAAARLEGPEA